MVTALVIDAGVKDAEISLALVGAGAIRRLNREYLGHDWVTDVIAFDLSAGGGEILMGDIYVCLVQAREQARKFGVSHEEELFRLAAHGTLHLLGYDHEKDGERENMFAVQERTVERFFDKSLSGTITGGRTA
jgi:probable rRNA maturation factor